MAGVRVLLFERHDPKEGEPAWTMFFAQRPDKRDQPTRGQATSDRAREATPEPAPARPLSQNQGERRV
jgi:hypothetical protein